MRSTNVKSDIRFILDGEEFNYDVGITTPLCPRESEPVVWPADAQIDERLATARSTTSVLPMWHDPIDDDVEAVGPSSSDENVEALRVRMFRQLAWQQAILPAIQAMERDKCNHYQLVNKYVTPLICTAGGSVSETFKQTLQQLAAKSHTGFRDRALFKARLRGHISILLIKFAAHMRRDQCAFVASGRSV